MLDSIHEDNADKRVGIDMVKTAIKVPAKTIYMNSGEEGSVIVGNLLAQDSNTKGFNAYTCE